MKVILIVILCYGLLLQYIVKQKKINKKIEKLKLIYSDNNLQKNIEFLLSIARGENIKCNTFNIMNNLDVNNLTVKNGSEFNGGKHFFQGEKNVGRLRIGSYKGMPGIYAEDGKDLTLGSDSTIINGKIKILNNLNIQNNFVTTLNV